MKVLICAVPRNSAWIWHLMEVFFWMHWIMTENVNLSAKRPFQTKIQTGIDDNSFLSVSQVLQTLASATFARVRAFQCFPACLMRRMNWIRFATHNLWRLQINNNWHINSFGVSTNVWIIFINQTFPVRKSAFVENFCLVGLDKTIYAPSRKDCAVVSWLDAILE